jgi:uncharacterized membrane protein YqjE
MHTAERPGPTGLWHAATRLLGGVLGLLHTRLDLLVLELEEEKERLKQTLLLAVAGMFCLSFSLLLLTLFVVVAFWDSHRLIALGSLTLLYFVLGVAALMAVRAKARGRPRPFAATLEEISKDRERLSALP